MKMLEMLTKVNDYVVFLSFKEGGFVITIFKCVEKGLVYADVSDKYDSDIFSDLNTLEDKIERLVYGVDFRTIRDQKEVENLFDKLFAEELTLGSDDEIPSVLSYNPLIATLVDSMDGLDGRVYIFKGNYDIDTIDKHMVLCIVNNDTKVGELPLNYAISFSRDLEHIRVRKSEGIGFENCSMQEIKDITNKFLDIMDEICNSKKTVEGLSTYEDYDMNKTFYTVAEYLHENMDGAILALLIEGDNDKSSYLAKMVYNDKNVDDAELSTLAKNSKDFVLGMLDEIYGDKHLNTELTYQDVIFGEALSHGKMIVKEFKENKKSMFPYTQSITLKSLENAIKAGYIHMNVSEPNGPKSLYILENKFERPELNVTKEEEYFKLSEEDRELVYESLTEALLPEEMVVLGSTFDFTNFGYNTEEGSLIIMVGDKPVIIPRFNAELIDIWDLKPWVQEILDKVSE